MRRDSETEKPYTASGKEPVGGFSSGKESGAQEKTERFPERIVPLPLGGQTPREKELRAKAGRAGNEQEETRLLREARSEHDRALAASRDIEPDKRLDAIQRFRNLVREAELARAAAKSASPDERMTWLAVFSQKRAAINELLQNTGPLSFEKAYREYITERKDFFHYQSLGKRLQEIQKTLEKSSVREALPKKKSESATMRAARAESLSREMTPAKTLEELLQELRYLYSEESSEFQEASEELKKQYKARQGQPAPKSKAELEHERDQLSTERTELWKRPWVRRFKKESDTNLLLEQMDEGKDVLELQSTLRLLNQLHEWEALHSNSTIGGVLVGVPGVGKTTLVRHYLEQQGRPFVYIDLSEEVTRYMLFGARSVEFRTEKDYAEHLIGKLEGLGEEDVVKLVAENAEKFRKMIPDLPKDDSFALAIQSLDEHVSHAASTEGIDAERAKKLKEGLHTIADHAFRKELATNFAELISKNGWRDGVVIHALRHGQSLILDEFNKAKEWSLLYGLLTAKPGEKWYFADNNEWIDIPKTWRMYFTGNIGRRHGGFEVAEALASRAAGRVTEIVFPPKEEEMYVAGASISGPDGKLYRSKEDLARLFLMIKEVFPRVREYIRDKRQAIPISFRTIRTIGEKLVQRRDEHGKPLFRTTEKSLDETIWETIVQSYALYEDREIPKEVVKLFVDAGFFLTDELKAKVAPEYLSEDEFERIRKTTEEHKQDFDALVKELWGEKQNTGA